MGFIDNMKAKQEALQNKVNDKRSKEAESYLSEGEQIKHLFATNSLSGDDFAAITDRRVIAIDKSLISSKNAVYSIPLSRINFVGLQRGGFMQFSKEVEFSSGGKSFELKFLDESKALQFYNALSAAVA